LSKLFIYPYSFFFVFFEALKDASFFDGFCWHVLQERVCLSLMERTEGGAEGRKISGELMNEDQKLRRDGTIKLISNQDRRICKPDQRQG
jgi:hypothetical protein